jgi:hypothetical protein
MPLDLGLDLAHALDPIAFVQDRLKFEPDPWQARLLRSRAPWILLNCCRQSGARDNQPEKSAVAPVSLNEPFEIVDQSELDHLGRKGSSRCPR